MHRAVQASGLPISLATQGGCDSGGGGVGGGGEIAFMGELSFTVSSICLISRDAATPFAVRACVPLRRRPPSTAAAAATSAAATSASTAIEMMGVRGSGSSTGQASAVGEGGQGRVGGDNVLLSFPSQLPNSSSHAPGRFPLARTPASLGGPSGGGSQSSWCSDSSLWNESDGR